MEELRVNVELPYLPQSTPEYHNLHEYPCQIHPAIGEHPAIKRSESICCYPDLTELMQKSASNLSSMSDTDSLPALEMLKFINSTEEDILLSINGYKLIDKICDTMQGKLFKAIITKINIRNYSNEPIGSYVSIKKIDKIFNFLHKIKHNKNHKH
eukprot:200041_1